MGEPVMRIERTTIHGSKVAIIVNGRMADGSACRGLRLTNAEGGVMDFAISDEALDAISELWMAVKIGSHWRPATAEESERWKPVKESADG